jgi:hypothetical protein
MFDAALSCRVTESLFGRQYLIMAGGNVAENSSSSVASVAIVVIILLAIFAFYFLFGRGVHAKETSISILRVPARTCRSTNAEEELVSKKVPITRPGGGCARSWSCTEK